MVVPTGIEPILPPYQGDVLPLNYGTMAGGKRFELLLPQSKGDVLPLHQPPMVQTVGNAPTYDVFRTSANLSQLSLHYNTVLYLTPSTACFTVILATPNLSAQ